MEPVSVRFDYGSRSVIFETGKIARQASGAVLASMGDTVVLCTVVGRPGGEPRDFFPLTVDYQERTYAAGKIPGGFFKREGRPSEREILNSRLIDRPVAARMLARRATQGLETSAPTMKKTTPQTGQQRYFFRPLRSTGMPATGSRPLTTTANLRVAFPTVRLLNRHSLKLPTLTSKATSPLWLSPRQIDSSRCTRFTPM
mgnify:CR=1 FL=1